MSESANLAAKACSLNHHFWELHRNLYSNEGIFVVESWIKSKRKRHEADKKNLTMSAILRAGYSWQIFSTKTIDHRNIEEISKNTGTSSIKSMI